MKRWKHLKAYAVGPRELAVMVDVLKAATAAGTLSPEQVAAFSGDPLDIPRDFETMTVHRVLVFYTPKEQGS